MLRGAGDSLLEKACWFIGFLTLGFWLLVAWLLCFKVSWFRGFLVPKLLGVKVSKIQTCSFHVFRKILIPYSRFSRKCKTDLHEFAVSVF